MIINKHDTQGTKPLLGKGELGYDDYTAGGDVGRVYVGTGSENIALAERLESNMMTKAQFNALAEERKASRAGSGFDEWGKHLNNGTSIVNVNEGIFTVNNAANANTFYLGDSVGIGVSKTVNPIMNINGTRQSIAYINNAGNSSNKIILPTAPNIYPHDATLTTEQIASGVIKHADASNSGLVTMGKNLTGTTFNQTVTVVNGKKYVIEYKDNGVRKALEVTASSTSYIISLLGTNITEVGMYPADSISRSDLVFLESWHEDISEKNFVYPLGNTQYLGGNTDGLTGITNGNFTGFETYSLFGNWQTPSGLIGKGYIWSNLTEAQKKAFIANSENNCYLDGDKVIQVRYRVRVVQGLGDNWINITTDASLRYDSNINNVALKGKLASITSDFVGDGLARFITYMATVAVAQASIGSFAPYNSINSAYEGKCFALPIALVHRRNQGAYHPTYNPNGTSSRWYSEGSTLAWHSTLIPPIVSISDCFNFASPSNVQIGKVPSGIYGAFISSVPSCIKRPDGLFYDQVHESDITDLRNSSKKVEDYNRLIGREFNKLVAGTTRGKEGEWEIKYYFSLNITAIAASVWQGFTSYKFATNPPVEYRFGTYAGINHNYKAYYINGSSVTEIYAIQPDGYFFIGNPTVSSGYVVIATKSTRTKSNTLLHCDIIGNPTNYPTSWKQSGIFGTPLIVAEDGTSLLPDGVRDTFKLSRKANATPLLCLRSTDSGATWTSFTPTFSTTTNEITLTNEPANNLVMVYYQTKTITAVPVVNSEVLETGEVLGTNGLTSGALISTLIGKVPTANTAPYLQMGYDVNGYRVDMSTFKFSTTATEIPTHNVLNLAGGELGVPAVKVFPYLTRTNGKAYLNLVFKEMKYNGTSWGDDTKFNIVDNVSTTTDFYGATVLIGQKTVELPYFIEQGE